MLLGFNSYVRGVCHHGTPFCTSYKCLYIQTVVKHITSVCTYRQS
jgi:hypothetical protein